MAAAGGGDDDDVITTQVMTSSSQKDQPKLIVVLWNCPLETVKIGDGHELLNCDDHAAQLRKRRRDVQEARPDIVHQCLLTLLDSPLNKAGRLQVILQTTQNVLIEVHPQCRIPRTFPRFAGLMVQLLHKFKIRASNSSHTLLQVIKNPITQHFPTDCVRLGFSHKSGKVVDINDFAEVNFGASSAADGGAAANLQGKSVVVVIGGFAHGKIDVDWTQEDISISNYQLSASVACGKVCCAFERVWDIL